MFENANFIDKINCYKSHYHKASKTTANAIKFLLIKLKWYHVLII